MRPGEYAELPLSGCIILENGEVTEFRAKERGVQDGKKIVTGAYYIKQGRIIGPFTIEVKDGMVNVT